MLELGIIGMSPGNAHPYSWSSIINGQFDGDEITRVGYPAVTNYLEANRDTLGIHSARVTHVWTQERSISESIASSSGINRVEERIEDMIGQVDGILLMRDDPNNHVAMAKPFIDEGIPVFIDKPVAATQEDLDYFSNEVAKGKFILSCSSMRYAGECRSAKAILNTLGPLELVTAVGKKDWIKYGVHMLEAIFALLGDPEPIKATSIGEEGRSIVKVKFKNGLLITVHLFMDISSTFQISLFGQLDWYHINIKNSYSNFRNSIIEIIRSLHEGKPRLSFYKTGNIIRTLLAAEESFKKGGKTIDI